MTNQLANPSFETSDLSGYSAAGGGTLTQQASANATDGTSTLRNASTATGTLSLNSNAQTIAASPGQVWSAGIDARSHAGTARNIRVDIQWVDSGNVVLSTDLGTSVLLTGSMVRQKNEGKTAPASTAGVRIRVSYLSTVSGDTYEADAIQLEQGATLPAFNPASGTTGSIDGENGVPIALEDGTILLKET